MPLIRLYYPGEGKKMPGCDHGLVSVLMSVYNGAPTLEKAAASVLAQTYRNL